MSTLRRDEGGPNTSDDVYGAPIRLGPLSEEETRHATNLLRSWREGSDEEAGDDPDGWAMVEEGLAERHRDPSVSVIPRGFRLHEPPAERQARIERSLAALRSLYEGDPEEQRETWEVLRVALDEGRPSGRKLFTEE